MKIKITLLKTFSCLKKILKIHSQFLQVVTVDKDEHERILLEHLNTLFTSAPGSSDVQYDYGDEEPGPLQLSIPIGYDPQTAPLQSQDQADMVNTYFITFL